LAGSVAQVVALPGPAGAGPGSSAPGGAWAVNQIHTHRAALMSASSGAVDHLVIDVVGGLFDQILGDTRVPPAMAREISRLQLPVLRVTLKDPGFFASGQHPVRLFVNRLASLGCAFDNFDAGTARSFLDRVRALVQQILDGDFEQVHLYAGKLQELDTFVAQQARLRLEKASAAPSLLAGKEAELRAQQRYRGQLEAGLAPLGLPDFLKAFLAEVWSQALVVARRQRHDLGDAVDRYRRLACELVLSLKPKSVAHRQQVVAGIPAQMRELNEGLRLIGWPVEAKQRFLRELLPLQSQALKSPLCSELEHNLLARRLHAVFATPIPEPAGAATHAGPESAQPRSLEAEAWLEPSLTPEQARRLGWMTEDDLPPEVRIADPATAAASLPKGEPGLESSGAVDTLAQPAYALTLPADFTDASTVPMGLGPAPSDPLAPVAAARGIPVAAAGSPAAAAPERGPDLAEHLVIGNAYEMLIKERWQKVRLSHISPGRAFFVFTHGTDHQQTVSMTVRMVRRVCGSGRLRAFEAVPLVERASERFQRQAPTVADGLQTLAEPAAPTPPAPPERPDMPRPPTAAIGPRPSRPSVASMASRTPNGEPATTQAPKARPASATPPPASIPAPTPEPVAVTAPVAATPEPSGIDRWLRHPASVH
jgi:hypothetical protein